MKNKIYRLLITLLILSLTACSANFTTTDSSNNNEIIVQAVSEDPVVSAETTIVETVSAGHVAIYEDPDDYIWDDADAVSITLNGGNIISDDKGVLVEKSRITITTAGTYMLSGELSDGQIIVDTEDEAIVRIILNNVSIYNSSGPVILIQNAEKAMIVLADGSLNKLSDSPSADSEVSLDNSSEDEANAAIFSKADLTIYGNGTLNVEANNNDGITSKDGLLISSGTISITALDDGLRGKDYVVIKDGNLSINAGGDGIKSDEDEDTNKGYVTIEAGQIQINAIGDAIAARSDLTILDGVFNLITGGGITGQLTGYAIDEATSAKGLKGTAGITISGGDFTIETADDGIHSNNNITINGGSFRIESADDGVHADATLTINSGQIDITGSYEGLESAVITINNGEIRIVSSDDGINAGGGADSSGMMNGIDSTGMPEGIQPGTRPGGSGGNGGFGGTGEDMFAENGNYYLYINGGLIYMDAGGDGIDSNGSIEMTGGLVLVNGPTNNGNGALDYAGTFNISGGFLIAAGSAGMAQAPSDSSSQNAVLVNFDSAQNAGTLLHVQNSSGETIFTFAPAKDFQSVIFSTPELSNGDTYSISTGGNVSSSDTYGLYSEGVYSNGIEYDSFTITAVITQIGSGGGGMFRR